MPPPEDARLTALSKKIETAQHDSAVLPPPPEKTAPSPSERAGMRAGSELIGGLLGGLMFGYFFDYMFETRPYGLVIGLLLGIVAGFYGVYRYTLATK